MIDGFETKKFCIYIHLFVPATASVGGVSRDVRCLLGLQPMQLKPQRPLLSLLS